MATPYLQFRREEVSSTQDEARLMLGALPVVVMARCQTAGRGRSGSSWITAPRAVAVSAAFEVAVDDDRPFSLMAGVACLRAVDAVSLKWPNDILLGDRKVGGILVERSGQEVVAGMGLNLWWPGAPDGMGAVGEEDPGEGAQAEFGGLWAAEFLHLVSREGWPKEEYVARCATVGRQITWEPDGAGFAVDVSDDGALVVEQAGTRRSIVAGAIRHLRG